MKKFRLFLLLVFFTTVIFSQSYDGKGDIKLSIGYDLYGFGNGIRANLDYGLTDIFSVGAGASYYFSNPDNDYYLYGRTAIHLGLLLDFHSKFDLYPGIQVGYLSGNDIGFDAFIGAKYFFTEKIGIYAEIGRNGSIGLSINL
ncbi:MAG: DUF6646 family protein [Bacteroidota bacterium]